MSERPELTQKDFEPMDPADLQALVEGLTDGEAVVSGHTSDLSSEEDQGLEEDMTVTRITINSEVLYEDSEAFKAQEEYFRCLHPEYMAAEDQGRLKARGGDAP